MAGSSWFRGPKFCYATSPKGYWCTRTDRHSVHQAAGGDGRVHSSWRGDFPGDDKLLESFTSEDGLRKALGNTPTDDLSAADHNDLIRGLE